MSPSGTVSSSWISADASSWTRFSSARGTRTGASTVSCDCSRFSASFPTFSVWLKLDPSQRVSDIGPRAWGQLAPALRDGASHERLDIAVDVGKGVAVVVDLR